MNLPLHVRILNFFRQVWMTPALESWLVKRTAGRLPDKGWSKLVPNPYQYPSKSYREFQREGIHMRMDISDYVGHYLYFGFEDRGTRTLFSLVKPTSHVVDVGANIGWTALCMASLAKDGWVMAFEPDQVNHAACTKNISGNSLPNIELFQVALGDTKGTVQLEVRTPSNLGGNRVAPKGGGGGAEVSSCPLDHMTAQFPDAHVDLIKIDVEGYELKVLRGAIETLRRCKSVLFVELDDNNLRDQGDSAQMLVRFLEDLGYHVEDASTGVKIRSDQLFENCHTDLVGRPSR